DPHFAIVAVNVLCALAKSAIKTTVPANEVGKSIVGRAVPDFSHHESTLAFWRVLAASDGRRNPNPAQHAQNANRVLVHIPYSPCHRGESSLTRVPDLLPRRAVLSDQPRIGFAVVDDLFLAGIPANGSPHLQGNIPKQ